MHLDNIRLFNFRNFVLENFAPAPGLNYIVGLNGHGKTNLLEAIALLSSGRSFRTAHSAELCRRGETSCSVFGRVSAGRHKFEIGVIIEDKHKRGMVDDKEVPTLREFLGRLLCVLFAPSEIQLVKGPPAERRRFLDRHIVELNPAILAHLLEYDHALRSKNKVLEEPSVSIEMLRSWNVILARAGAKIMQARRDLLLELEPRADSMLANFAVPDRPLTLKLQESFGGDASDEGAGLAAALEQAAQQEIRRRRTVVGPHRDELLIGFADRDARAFASLGQSKSIVLALKLAMVELIEEKRGESPVLLIDDLGSELDSERTEALLENLCAKQRQTFITATELPAAGLSAEQEINVIYVENGSLKGTLDRPFENDRTEDRL